MEQEAINLETVIARNESMLANELGDDFVMMDIDKGAYYGLESVAARIWELTENPVSLSSICETLISEYDVPQEKCQEEVNQFLTDLLNRQIVRIHA